MRTVELLPDAAVDAVVRRAWQRLAEAGLPSLADHRHPTNRPHLTLAEADGLDGEGLGTVALVVASALPIAVHAGALGLFAHRGVVLHLALTPSPELVALHERVLTLLAAEGCAPHSRSRPGAWLPHLTLATRLSREQLPAALDVVGDALPIGGTFTAARSYDSVSRTVTPLVRLPT